MNSVILQKFPELAGFLDAAQDHYGSRLHGAYLFGSRARGDHRVDSDYDVAVVLRSLDDFWGEQTRLADLAFDAMLEQEIYIQPFPFGLNEWDARKRDLVVCAREVALELQP